LIRPDLCRLLRSRLYSNARNETEKRAGTSAVVFAPHQDDETLGCGGTIFLKRRTGAPVACVFMTDGSASHKRFIPEEELRGLRKTEALEAVEVLGVKREDVHFLDFPDGKLDEFRETAVGKTVEFLENYRPEEVYAPSRTDGIPDHECTYCVIVEAVRRSGRLIDICEYPVWLWSRWPWVPLKIRPGGDTIKSAMKGIQAGFGLRLIHNFRSAVYVGDSLAAKRQALSKYKTQMTVLRPGVEWPTLGKISDGEFMKCFFQEFEVFRCRKNRRP
jgi:LmbE family N-acetylglucosaminyl deacetylase